MCSFQEKHNFAGFSAIILTLGNHYEKNNTDVLKKEFWQNLCSVNIPSAQVARLVVSSLCLHCSEHKLEPEGDLRMTAYVECISLRLM